MNSFKNLELDYFASMNKLFFLLLLTSLAVATDIRVGISTTFPDGRTLLNCLSVNEGTSAEEILKQTQLETIFTKESQFGKALAKVGEAGCSATDPWCQCNTNCCLLWNLWYSENGKMEFSSVGYSLLIPKNNSVVASIWGRDFDDKPPSYSIEYICENNSTIIQTNYSQALTCDEVPSKGQKKQTSTATQSTSPIGLIIFIASLLAGTWVALKR